MGGFIHCIKTEYNLGIEKMTNVEEDEIDDDNEGREEMEEKGKEKMEVLKDISGRHRTEGVIHVNVNNSNMIHYNENFLDINGENTRKKSNTIFIKPTNLNNI